MSYGLAYTLPFSSIDEKAYRIEIERNGYTGDSRELTGAPSPFTVEIEEEEFIYIPTRVSTARLNVFGGDYLQDLFSTDYRMHRVTLYENDVPVWFGFISPELYSQDYCNTEFELEIQCHSAMSVLKYVDYNQQYSDRKKFISLWDLLKLCVSESRANYSAVYIPHVYGRNQSSFLSWENPLQYMIIAEQDFFDEEGKPMKLFEILEEIMKFMNWTCCDWQGSLYFVDADNSSKEYYKYNLSMTSYQQATADEKLVQNIGFAGSNHTLDIIPGYNKATIRCSNYPVGKLVPDEDYDRLRVIKRPADLEKLINKKTKIINHSLVLEGNEYITYQYDNNSQPIQFPTGEDYDSLGATLVKRCIYEQKESGGQWDDSITSYNYENLVRVRTTTADGMYSLPPNVTNNTPILSFKTSTSEVIYAKGALALSFSAQICMNADLGVYKDKIPDSANLEIPVLVRLGNKYWQNWSNSWIDEPMFTLCEFVGKDMKEGSFAPMEDTKTIDMPYDNLRGLIMEIPEDMKGDIELSIYKPQSMDLGNSAFFSYGCYLKDVSLKYERLQQGDVYQDNADRTYENVVNENYINELDEIEFKINSYNNDGACYAKVSFSSGGYLSNNLYCSIVDEAIRPEEFLIRRIVDHYSAPKIKLRQVLKKGDIKPFTNLRERFAAGKKFMSCGGTIDYKMNEFECSMIEI